MTDTALRSLSSWDYTIIVFYLLFIVGIGVVCRRISKNASDYFRGGGNMLWWVAGISVMASSISTWTFTGGAAKCYRDGFVFPLTGWLAAIPSAIFMLMISPRFRRFRVITAMEAVFRRFGFGTEQFYTWITLPMGLFFGGVGLNTLGVFMSSAFHTDLRMTIFVVGGIVLFLSTLGGQWGVAVGAFVQGLVMFLIVTVVVFFSINQPEIGGPSKLLSSLPQHHIRFDLQPGSDLLLVWIVWTTFSNAMGPLDLRNCGKFVRVKDESHARRMVMVQAVPTILLLMPLWFQLPAMCAAVIFPDLKPMFPQLKNPEEGAWVAMSFRVLPDGLLGLMVCGMFSAAIDNLDAGLNTNAGFFVRNVYLRYLKPEATNRQQLLAGKLATVTFGVLMIGVGLTINALRSSNLFDFFQIFNAMVLGPLMVPMILGLFIKRTPAWSGWSTVLAGLAAAVIAKQNFSTAWVARLMDRSGALTPREALDAEFIFIGLITFAVSIGWFLLTMRWYKESSPEHQQRMDELFADLQRPIDRVAEGNADQDAMQYKIIGALCMIMGGFLLLCMAIPNPLRGRLAFLFVGGVPFSLGLVLWSIYRRKARRQPEAITPAEPLELATAKASA